jgi:hypothetical protein
MNTSKAPANQDLEDLRNLLRDLLLRWESAKLNEKQVHEETDRIWAEREWPEFKNSDGRSVIVEVLSQLSMLNAQWIIAEDIPMMLSFLDTPSGQEFQAWEKWREYWKGIDYAARRKKIADNSYYSQSGPGTSVL